MPTGLHHVRAGGGPQLVLLAGIGMSGAAWQPVIVATSASVCLLESASVR